MKNTLYFPSYAEFIQRSETLKNRQDRLIQVRQNEKKKSAEFLEKMRNRAQTEYEDMERYIVNEICEHHSKELAAMRQVYEDCIAKINQEHYNNKVQSKAIRSRASIRVPAEQNVLRKKSPVKTVVISENSQKTSNTMKDSVRSHENTDPIPQKRNCSPVKKTIVNENQNKAEGRTTSIYHEKCVPALQRSKSPQKKLSSVKSIQAVPNVIANQDHSKKEFSVKSVQTTPKVIIVNEDLIRKVTDPPEHSFLKKSTEDFINSYTQRVHDRIRILEQKERMLQRRAGHLPDLNRFANIPSTKDCDANPAKVTTARSESTDRRASPAIKTKSEVTTERTELPKEPSRAVATNTEGNSDLIFKKTCSTAVQTSRSCRKKKRRCKRASLAKDEDMIIFIRNHRSGISETIEDTIPSNVVEQISSNASRETESSVSETEKISLSVQKIVRTTAHDANEHPRVQKLENWRRLFVNGEKLSESSYYSPPDPSRVARNIVINRKKKCERNLVCNAANDEYEKDIGYYVAKLLLMSPESIENLSTVHEESLSSISVNGMDNEKLGLFAQSDSDKGIDEEEFLRRMLEITIPNRETPEKKISISHEASPQRVHFDSFATIAETNIKSGMSSITVPENADSPLKSEDYVLKDTSATNLKLDPKLSGWIEASIRRTLEASAVNSTSSYDEYDGVRQVDQLVRSLIEKNEYFLSSGNASSSSTCFSFSPVAVPDIHLNIPQLSGAST